VSQRRFVRRNGRLAVDFSSSPDSECERSVAPAKHAFASAVWSKSAIAGGTASLAVSCSDKIIHHADAISIEAFNLHQKLKRMHRYPATEWLGDSPDMLCWIPACAGMTAKVRESEEQQVPQFWLCRAATRCFIIRVQYENDVACFVGNRWCGILCLRHRTASGRATLRFGQY
jgi:hypothetical protein